jgi:hypothetical protein
MPYKDPEQRRAAGREREARRYRLKREHILAKRREPRAKQLRAAQAARWRAAHASAAVDRTTLPDPYQGHVLFDAAHALVGRVWYGDTMYDPLKEDAMSEAILAMLEGRDPREAVRHYLAAERAWTARTYPIAPEL